MIKTLTKHGNSLALIIDKPILELLKINEQTPLNISTTDGKTLHITPVEVELDKRKEKFDKALENVNKKFSNTLKKLA